MSLENERKGHSVGIRMRWVELSVMDGRPLFGNTGQIKRAYGIWNGPVGVS
jgi:hypothetical protein